MGLGNIFKVLLLALEDKTGSEYQQCLLMRAIAILLFKKWSATCVEYFEIFKQQLRNAQSKQSSVMNHSVGMQLEPTNVLG